MYKLLFGHQKGHDEGAGSGRRMGENIPAEGVPSEEPE